jgi:GTPase
MKLNNIDPTTLDPSPEEYEEELDYGNKEYKLKLVDIGKEKLQKRITQMEFRLREGNGECRYYIGVEDLGNPLGINEDEMQTSLKVVEEMTQKIGAKITFVHLMKGNEGLVAEIWITKPLNWRESDNKIEIRIGLIGEEGSGKSTLVK